MLSPFLEIPESLLSFRKRVTKADFSEATEVLNPFKNISILPGPIRYSPGNMGEEVER
jgi:hypothetical protein